MTVSHDRSLLLSVLFVSKERKRGSILLHGRLELDSTTDDSLDMPAVLTRFSGVQPDGGWGKS